MTEPTIEFRDLESLPSDPHNLRQHPERNAALVQQSIQEVGFGRPILLDGDRGDEVMAGNQTKESALAAGFTRALIIETDGDVVVAHRRRGLTEEQKIRLKVYDNLSSDTSEFSDVLFGTLLADEPGIMDGILTQAEQDYYLLAAGSEAGKQELKEDAGPRESPADELRELWQTSSGQIWQIPSLTVPGAAHRLVIGDSRNQSVIDRLFRRVPSHKTKVESNDPPLSSLHLPLSTSSPVCRCVWTDPPYGVDYASKNVYLNKGDRGNRIQTPIEGDKLTPQQTEETIRAALTCLGHWTDVGASVYLCGPSADLMIAFLRSFQGSPFKFHQALVWVKNNHVLGMNDYQYLHEMVYYGWKPDGGHYWDGERGIFSCFFVDKPRSSAYHPTTKPVELVEAMIIHSSKSGEVVADPFLGSGSTLVACEQQGRLCYGAELTPEYAAVTLQRAQDLGLTPELYREE